MPPMDSLDATRDDMLREIAKAGKRIQAAKRWSDKAMMGRGCAP